MSATDHDPYALDKSGIQEPPATLWQALRKIGPGIVLAGSIIGSGELLLTTALGAEYGFVFLGLILFSCVIKVFVQIELGRYTISSGEPTLTAFDRLPGWRLGAHWLTWWWFIMLLGSVFQLGGMVGGVGQAMDMAFPGLTSGMANAADAVLWRETDTHTQANKEAALAKLDQHIAALQKLSDAQQKILTQTNEWLANEPNQEAFARLATTQWEVRAKTRIVTKEIAATAANPPRIPATPTVDAATGNQLSAADKLKKLETEGAAFCARQAVFQLQAAIAVLKAESNAYQSSPGKYLRTHREHLWGILTALAAVALLLSGGYKRIEFITTFLVVGVTLITVVCACMLSGTDYPIEAKDVADGFSLAKIRELPLIAVAAAFAAFGITGVGANELYAYPYWCLEKGYARYAGPRSDDAEWARGAKGWLRVMYLDAWISCVVFTVATVAFYAMGATVLHKQDLHPDKSTMIATLAEMYVPAFGTWTKMFFLVGVWAVLFKTLYVASAGHARLSADFMGLLGVAKYDKSSARADRMWWTRAFCVFYPLLALCCFLFLRNPKALVIIGGFVQAATLPLISAVALYLRYFRLDPRLKPAWTSDLCMWVALVTITAVSLYAIPSWVQSDFLPWVQSFGAAVK